MRAILRQLLDLIWISEARAIELKFTHEGRLFGVPAWMDAFDPAVITAVPKVPVLQLYAILVDTVITFWVDHFGDPNRLYDSPIRTTRRIS